MCFRPPGPGQMRGGGALTNARPPVGAPTSSRRSVGFLVFVGRMNHHTAKNVLWQICASVAEEHQAKSKHTSAKTPGQSLLKGGDQFSFKSASLWISSRLPNYASSFSAANAAAAIGGTRSASPRSTAAMPSSRRRWATEMEQGVYLQSGSVSVRN